MSKCEKCSGTGLKPVEPIESVVGDWQQKGRMRDAAAQGEKMPCDRCEGSGLDAKLEVIEDVVEVEILTDEDEIDLPFAAPGFNAPDAKELAQTEVDVRDPELPFRKMLEQEEAAGIKDGDKDTNVKPELPFGAMLEQADPVKPSKKKH